MKKILFLAVFVVTLRFGVSPVHAQSSAHFNITRSVIASGGTTFSTSSHFKLGSTIGQPLAAVPSSAHFSIQGGFWIQPAPIIFAPTKTGNNFMLSFQTELGETYTAQYIDSLSTSNWQNTPSVVGDGTVQTVTNSTTSTPQRFYRLNQQP